VVLAKAVLGMLFAVLLGAQDVAGADAFSKPGDANGDGRVDEADARLILQKAASAVVLGGIEADAADVNRDGSVDPRDAILALQSAAAGSAFSWEGFEARAGLGDGQVAIELVFAGPSARIGDSVEARLLDLAGGVEELRTVSLGGSADRRLGSFSFPLAGVVSSADLASYVLELEAEQGEDIVRQRVSLYQLVSRLRMHMFGPERWYASALNRARIAVQESPSGRPLEGSVVTAALTKPGGGEVYAQVEGRTDADGVVDAALRVPGGLSGDGELVVSVDSPLGRRVMVQSVEIVEGTTTLLTTDKPLYQPGQTIHIRALSLKKPQMVPAAGEEIVLIVADAKGNKVFKQAGIMNDFGVASADFTLATELNLGLYTVAAEIRGSTTEKKVTVERYALPKFKVALDTDRDFYPPGAKLSGTVAADYFFGKSVQGAAVTIEASKFDVGFEPFAEVSGRTDAQGRFEFSLDLPSYFVGQPLQQGEAFALLEVTVIDTAAHQESISRSVPVSASEIVIHAVPESGHLISGVPNRIYILTLYPNNAPAQTTCTALVGGEVVDTVTTDAAGIGIVTVTPAGQSAVTLELHAADSEGNSADRSVDLAFGGGAEGLLIRTDRALYAVGDAVKADVYCGGLGGSVFIDVVKEGQTLYSRSLSPEGGHTALVLPLTADMSGTLSLSAYRITVGGDTIRDRRIIYVDPANDLRLDYAPDKEVYLPGEEAAIRLHVSGRDGQPVAAAIGLTIVDEAVFALQEMQPGMEKVYFYLEEQLRQPRYEIHGFTPEEIVYDPLGPDSDTARERALGMMFAALGTIPLGTFERVSDAADGEALRETLRDAVWADLDVLIEVLGDELGWHDRDLSTAYFESLLQDVAEEGDLESGDAVADPWGTPYRIRYAAATGEYSFLCAGLDKRWDTSDDLTLVASYWTVRYPWWRENPEWWVIANGGFDGLVVFAQGFGWLEDGVGGWGPPSVGPSAGGGETQPYLRQYFPETLYANPLVITGADGTATVNLKMADSITSWRMTGMASSADGRLGSATGALRVFQEFFVDLDLPPALTRGDEVSVPIAIYNYLPEGQTIRLTIEGGDGFELIDAPERTITLGANEVTVTYFRIKTVRVGRFTLEVTAYGSTRSDAIAREVEVMPDGAEVLVTHSGRMSGTIDRTVAIPEEAIDGASKILVKIYPGLFSQVVEGLDSMLQMPYGCFEQTSSVTYPNVLVVEYMKSTGQITPEILMKAEGFISTGYQRLLSYEVEGGGFSWFGDAPAHNVLTTYGLLEFSDMSKVWYVDPAVIRRTQDWLVAGQEPDGSWIPTDGGIAEGAIDRFQNDVLRTSAYVVWALTSSGYSGAAVASGTAYVKAQLARPDWQPETYTLALCAHALLCDANDPLLPGLFDEFERRKHEEGDRVWWEETASTMTYSRGQGANVELTALLAQAYLRFGGYPDTTGKALNYLASSKDGHGNFGSTQATVQALKAFALAAGGVTTPADATVGIAINGTEVKTLRLTEANSDVLFLCDLGEQTVEGDNAVRLTFEGKGSNLYQLIGRYYLPWEGVDPPGDELLSIDVQYDKTQLTAADLLTCTVRVANNQPGKAKMVVVDVGIPPGFEVLRDDLDQLVGEAIQKYQVAGRQIIFYLDELDHAAPVSLVYRLAAQYPIRAKTPRSVVYEYYNPDVRGVAEPVEIAVTN